MANQANGLSHTKWMCKRHIVFTPKYRRKVILFRAQHKAQDTVRRDVGCAPRRAAQRPAQRI